MINADRKQEIRSILEGINQAWRDNRLEDLRDYFHSRMVLVAPDFEMRFEGADACIGSYADFVQQASVTHFQESDWQVDIYGETAVATYRFEIGYTLDEQPQEDSGRDIFVFTRENDQWKAIWRTMIMGVAQRVEVTRIPSDRF